MQMILLYVKVKLSVHVINISQRHYVAMHHIEMFKNTSEVQ